MARHVAVNSPSRRPRAATAPVGNMAETSRVAGVDALRGIAIVAMVAYNAAFDLAYFHVTSWNFYSDPFWLHSRTAILSSLLLLAGVSLVLAMRTPSGRMGFWPHVLRIAGCALVVSAATYVVFPRSFIWFGVLHAIALSLVLIRPLAPRPAIALALGAGVIAAGVLCSAPAFDQRWLGWIGFATTKPITEDYVPLFPWTGVMLVGIAAGHALARNGFRVVAPLGRLPTPLSWLGRHSLAIYMIHQPLLFGLVWLVAP